MGSAAAIASKLRAVSSLNPVDEEFLVLSGLYAALQYVPQNYCNASPTDDLQDGRLVSPTSFLSQPHPNIPTIQQDTEEQPGQVGLRLPTEVWLRIFGYAVVISPRSVARAAMLCSGIRGAAEEALYRWPVIYGIPAAKTFTAAISGSPRRAHAVRCLSLGCERGHERAFVPDTRKFLPLLTRLETLDLADLGTTVEQIAVALLSGRIVPSLRRLRGLPVSLGGRLIKVLRRYHQLEEFSFYAWDPPLGLNLEAFCEDGNPSPKMIHGLPELRAISLPAQILDSPCRVYGNITSLCITDATRTGMEPVARLFGAQLVSLRVERRLGTYTGMAYPTNWIQWEAFSRLKFLDVRDRGERVSVPVMLDVLVMYTLTRMLPQGAEVEGQIVHAERLPPSLETLVWGPTWVLDCAQIDLRTEKWRRDKIRSFADTVLRSCPNAKTVVYMWTKNTFYQRSLVNGRHYEILADAAAAGDYAWADKR